MVNLTVSLPKETVDRLRRLVAERYGGKKGAISGLVREALEDRMSSETKVRQPLTFTAFEGKLKVGTGATLDELASKLRQLDVDPRSVRIVSSTPLRKMLRVGLRGSRQ